jgi:serine/threonine-protein kinase
MKHPLIVKLVEYISDTSDHNSVIVTEFTVNGSLASHYPSSKGGLSGPNRITRIVIEIALTMRFFHSQTIIHCDLKPDNIHYFNPKRLQNLPYGDFRYLAPECYDKQYFQESDIFSFGLILYELLTGQLIFPKELTLIQITFIIIVEHELTDISKFVLSSARDLITDCWAKEPGDRLSFEEIVERLKKMKFKVIPNVNSRKLSAFDEAIEEWEARNSGILQ